MKLEQFQREKDFGAAVAIADGLRRRELIADSEYHKVRELLIKKYRPVISSLQGNPPQTG